jgi:3-oxoacyl-[acyl-carrier protein] reductase
MRRVEITQGNSSLDGRELDGKVVVVTGGSRGIGKGIVLAAAAEGARVAFCARTIGDAARETLKQGEQLAGLGHVIAVQADVSLEGDVDAFFDRTVETFGQVDIVVNNAGLYSAGAAAGPGSLLLQVPTSEWDGILAANLTGAFLVSRRAVKEFTRQGSGGSIISIGSVSQDGGTGLVSYAVSKAGLQGLTDSIAREYGDRGIRAHVVVVGFLRTDLNKDTPEKYLQMLIDWGPQKRAGSVEEIASVVLFLASRRSALFNGAPIFASGGGKDIPAYLVKI